MCSVRKRVLFRFGLFVILGGCLGLAAFVGPWHESYATPVSDLPNLRGSTHSLEDAPKWTIDPSAPAHWI